ncbi:MAG: efflux RND transporter permease subunit, partial [Planctomycetes bacterium]|nr:efflux RND transporter permease subunit [Planctomycetota bacterium]
MKSAVSWFVYNPVAANLLMLAILVGGLISTFSAKREVFPEFQPNIVSVSVVYPSASPEEVEESICSRIEEEIRGVDGIKEIKSTASEGIGLINAELIVGTDTSEALDDIKSRVDALDTLPEDAEQPVITELKPRRQTLSVAVSGNTDERSLRNWGQRIRDEIAQLDGITQVELSIARPFEIAIEVSEDTLRRHGLTFDDVVTAVQRSSLDLPGGSVKTDGGEVLLRAKGQAYSRREFEDFVLWTRPDGSVLRLGDVATVIDGFEDTEEFARFDGEPAVLIDIFRIGDQDALAISEEVHDYIERKRHELPEGITLTPWRDESVLLEGRLWLLIWNGVIGFVLVFAVLTLSMRLKLAMWVSLGIPVSFLGALWLMPMFGTSINMLSLFAFILVLGIVVDDAIVVGENVFTKSREGLRGIDAAVRGAREVAVPVTFAVLTTIAAFVPMLNVPGPIGELWAVIPIVVISTLIFSMIESKLILPAHLRHLDTRPPTNAIGRGWARFQGFFADSLEGIAKNLYRPTLAWALDRRYLTVAIATTILTITVGVIAGGYVRFVFFPPVDGDNVVVDLTMPAGTPAEQTFAELERMEAVALSLRDEFPGDIRNIMTSIGTQPFRKTQDEGGGKIVRGNSGSHFGEINIQLSPSEVRETGSKAIERRWRELTADVPGAVEVKFSSSLLNVGADLEIQLLGDDQEVLRDAVTKLENKLAEYPALSDVSNSYREGKAEIELDIRESAEPLGLKLEDLARQVRQGFYGAEAQRVQRGRDDIKVMVRYPESERTSLGDVERMRIRTPSGDEVPFATVAEVRYGRGPAAIQRVDGKQAISITAEVDEDESDANEILADLRRSFLPELVADHAGLSYSLEGEQQQQQDTLDGLSTGSLFALLLIFGLMAIPFGSYLQPLIVM